MEPFLLVESPLCGETTQPVVSLLVGEPLLPQNASQGLAVEVRHVLAVGLAAHVHLYPVAGWHCLLFDSNRDTMTLYLIPRERKFG